MKFKIDAKVQIDIQTIPCILDLSPYQALNCPGVWVPAADILFWSYYRAE